MNPTVDHGAVRFTTEYSPIIPEIKRIRALQGHQNGEQTDDNGTYTKNSMF
jgi:hypothetical protein